MYSLAEIQRRTRKPLDAWWTVLLVDPVAGRLVRFAARYRWITPNRLTALAAVVGLGAAACFAGQSRGWLVLGAVLFHLGFVADCVAGRIARLRGGGSLFGAWFDFMFDRVRAVLCALALMGGQYRRTGETVFVWLAALVIALDLLRYLNAGQMSRIRAVMRADPGYPTGERAGRDRVTAWLRRRRIRVHLVSGVEFEMFVFVVAPLTGWIAGVTLTAGALLAAFEVRLVVLLWQATRRHAAWTAARRPLVAR
ncbi:CDP-alcohol phosphatidyltransferase family protein [Actinoplanes sp. TBRC 11911]|uniref:CDP-alcohol phosphatidyltransferase family protein n=1 Tax=Actinoplanes sp. TBRC 11911 TaxID=2729386 RepID=UPI00145CD9A0|nr:CDP-alcohol phosphatidyltransferase family protein [Actinoplanes sp. TBRC 11911]NMO57383.1 CDP-alcohol phosphatidyltransferase family protein [Actinoplanes sp. TBRC 11911]